MSKSSPSKRLERLQLDISSDASRPHYQRIAEAICQAVLNGQLTPGQRLPTRQGLAQALGTSPVTVGRGYEWLLARKLVKQQRRSGTWLLPDALKVLQSQPASIMHSATSSGPSHGFMETVVVISEPDLSQVRRDQLEIITHILMGINDVLGDATGRLRYVCHLDHDSLKDVPDNSAVLVFGKQPAGTYESPALPALLHDLAQRRIAVMGVWSHDQMSILPQIQCSPYQAVNVACQHLLDCGYRRLGYIGDMGSELAPKFFEFTNVLFKAGLDFQFAHVREVGMKPGDAYQAGLDLAKQGLPDALFVDVDWKAMELLRAFELAGVKVPEDVAVVGFGDVPDLQLFCPGLSSVHLPRRDIGREVGRQLQAWLQHRTPLSSKLIDAWVVARQTTQPAGDQLEMNPRDNTAEQLHT